MKVGASISGGLHTALVVVAIWGVDWFTDQDDLPLTITEIELVNGTDFEAALSTAPVVPSEGPADLAQPSETQSDPGDVAQPTDATETAEAPRAAQAPPPDAKPDVPDLLIPPPPTDVPTEAPVATIAEIPSPDPLDRKALEPESPASTEPVQPLRSVEAPLPSSKPTPPPQPEPEPEQAKPDPEAVPEQPVETAEAQPVPQPEPTNEPEVAETPQAQPEAPEGPAPREARLPLAKPAELAAAAEAARKEEQRAQEEAEAKERERIAAATPKPEAQQQPSQQAGGSDRVQARPLSNGERNALRVGIKKYYTYSGDRSDRNLRVIIRVKLNKDGSLNGNPEQRTTQGGNANSQRALFQAGRRAIIRAAAAGAFKVLPQDKYGRWKVLNFRFSIDGVGKVS